MNHKSKFGVGGIVALLVVLLALPALALASPTVQVTATPDPVIVNQQITFNAVATSTVNIDKISLYIDSVLAKDCTINAQSGNCVYQTSYSAANSHTYYATANDVNGIGRDPPSGTRSFNVVASNSCGPGTPVGTISPSSKSGNSGTALTYTFSMKNNDNAGCGIGTFLLVANAPCGTALDCTIRDIPTGIIVTRNGVSYDTIDLVAGVSTGNLELNVSSNRGGSFDFNIEMQRVSPRPGPSGVSNTATAVFSIPTGKVEIKSIWATPTLLVDKDGCASLYPLEVSGLVQEDGAGTNDGVLVYVGPDLYDFVRASAANAGYFSSTIGSICFDTPGVYTVTTNVDRGSGTIATASATTDVIFTNASGGGSGTLPNLVDVESQPRILRTGAGTFSEILLSIENLGETSDTYEVKVTGGEAASWLDLEKGKVTVAPKQTVYVSLFVDIPSTAKADSYPINVIVQGRASDIDRAYIVVENEGTSGSGADNPVFAAPDYAVDVSVVPKGITVDAGESGEYVVTVQNIGKKTDTYELDVRVTSKITSWFTFNTAKLTLAAGEQRDVILFVDVPDSIGSRSYSVNVMVDGNAIDIERASLTVVPRDTFVDVMVGKVTLSETKLSSNIGKTISASAPVSFVDISGESAGDGITAKLYVNSRLVSTKNTFIPSGETKDVEFTFSTDSAPISGKPGTYNVVVTAGVGEEVDRSDAVQLVIVQAGGISITGVSQAEFNTTANSNASLKLTVTNTDIRDITVALSAEGSGDLEGKAKIAPSSFTVKAEGSKSQDVAVEVGNVVDGTYEITIKAASEQKSDTEIITVNVKGGYIVPEEPKKDVLGGIGTGLISFGTGGVLAAIVGALLIAFVLAYYYHSQGKLKLPEWLVRVFGKFRQPAVEGGNAAMAEAVQKEVEKPKTPSKPMVWESLDFESLKHLTENVSGQWHPKDAENTLLNLSGIKDEFKGTVKEAGKTMGKLTGKALDETAHSISQKIYYIKSIGAESKPSESKAPKKKTGDSFVDKVVGNI